MEGVLIPFISLTQEQREDHRVDGRIDHTTKGLDYVPYNNIPRLLSINFRANTAVGTNDYDSDESEEIASMLTLSSDLLESKVSIEWEPLLEWSKFQYNEESDDTSSQSTGCWHPNQKEDEKEMLLENEDKCDWDDHVLDVKAGWEDN